MPSHGDTVPPDRRSRRIRHKHRYVAAHPAVIHCEESIRVHAVHAAGDLQEIAGEGLLGGDGGDTEHEDREDKESRTDAASKAHG
jgi:hypothetical protein